jgi:UDP-sulfoquinovose synthase
MKILILGSDGYIGYPLTLHLLKQGHEVYGIDNHSRRRRVSELKSDSLTSILSISGRIGYLKNQYKDSINYSTIYLGIDPPGHIKSLLNHFKPDTIVHLAEQPSAPWSMQSAHHASVTQHENVIGTMHLLWAMHEECPEAHLVKLGTMGEYGTPNCDIPEGTIPPSPCIYTQGDGALSELGQCPMWGLLFPRTAGSFYHLSKVHDTLNIHFACRNWKLRSTDIMQGVVFGLANSSKIEELTRFDYDECFGTVINRFCAQAIVGHPLTVYGKGGQTRGFLTLNDSIQCLTLAIENSPSIGEYRTFNQLESIHSINNLAKMVCEEAHELGFNAKIDHLPNPRKEAEQHYYNPTHQKLFDLGYKPTIDMALEISRLIQQLLPFRDRIHEEVIDPKISWR